MAQLLLQMEGWTIFITGILIMAYRVWGIVQPRPWIEWTERQFAYITDLRYVGIVMAAFAAAAAYWGDTPSGTLGILFVASWVLLVLVGVGLAAVPNHVRLLVIATAESDEIVIRIVSIVIVIIGLLWTVAPWLI
ncbi:hypothetical protein GOV11_04030 [Candidatus Woesearchaeota archaeon]|nr:hypothetical protein [Candidatus Woesearchaeota archaeon]